MINANQIKNDSSKELQILESGIIQSRSHGKNFHDVNRVSDEAKKELIRSGYKIQEFPWDDISLCSFVRIHFN